MQEIPLLVVNEGAINDATLVQLRLHGTLNDGTRTGGRFGRLSGGGFAAKRKLRPSRHVTALGYSLQAVGRYSGVWTGLSSNTA